MNRRYTIPMLGCLLLTSACGSDDTSEPNGPNQPEASFAGKTYVAQPYFFNSDFGTNIRESVPAFILKVDGTASAYTVTLGTALRRDPLANPQPPLQQQLCNPTSTVSAVSNPYPGFHLGPTDVPIYAKPQSEDVAVLTKAYSLEMTNILPPEGGTSEGTLRAYLDAREIHSIVVQLEDPTPETVCSQVADMGLGMCEACPPGVDNGPGDFCLLLEAVYLEAEVVEGFELMPVTAPTGTCFLE